MRSYSGRPGSSDPLKAFHLMTDLNGSIRTGSIRETQSWPLWFRRSGLVDGRHELTGKVDDLVGADGSHGDGPGPLPCLALGPRRTAMKPSRRAVVDTPSSANCHVGRFCMDT